MEELDIAAFLAKFTDWPDLTMVERVILSHGSTVQTLLSVIFKAPVRVEVLAQMEVGGSILRWVRIVAREKTLALAFSVIPTSVDQGVLTDIRDRKMGLGQIIEKHGVRQKRSILGIYRDEQVFSRIYRLEGEGVEILITELFPRDIYREHGRLSSEGSEEGK